MRRAVESKRRVCFISGLMVTTPGMCEVGVLLHHYSNSVSCKVSAYQEKVLFFKRWLDKPFQLGALIPSSKALARAIAQHVVREQRQEMEYILEIGAGTGSFTQALLDAGVEPHRLICVEVDKQLYEYMKRRFPKVHVIWGSACQLKQLLPQQLHQNIALVLSGIPMMSIPSLIRDDIIEGCFHVLKPGGKIIQFTYSPFSSVSSKNYRLKQRRLETVFRNFPPATVWSYERQGACRLTA
jgi:phosphatidylethanolamine/phosphatidyl-N-methylethanolamine N-methyltransferase